MEADGLRGYNVHERPTLTSRKHGGVDEGERAMAERPDEIKQHIGTERERLGENLEHLEHKVRSAADWRAWVRRKPLLAFAAAFAAGLWLATRER